MSELVSPQIARIAPYEPGKPLEELERELGGAWPPGGAIKLASNENPLGPSPRAVEAAGRALAQAHRYPDGGAFYLRAALAERLGVARESVLVGLVNDFVPAQKASGQPKTRIFDRYLTGKELCTI